MKNEMFFPKDEEIEKIISLESPPEYNNNKNIILQRGFNEEEYNEIYEFLRDQNMMISGNYTLFPKSEIARYKKMDALGVLMRSGKNKSLIGTIFSVIFPIKCSFSREIVPHACTTFLNVHEKLRKHGLCMALIRELTRYAYENKIYCSYSLTSFPLNKNSIEISSWYRPINLPRSIGLGFSYPNWNTVSEFTNNRIKYNNKQPKKYECIRISTKNIKESLNFYREINKERRFVFMPDEKFFSKWINEYPSFIVSFQNKYVGIFSLSSIFFRTILDGVLAIPFIFNTLKEHSFKVMKCLISTVEKRDYDILYCHCIGDLTEELLESVNAIKTKDKSYFSFYNNSMKIKNTDLFIPLF